MFFYKKGKVKYRTSGRVDIKIRATEGQDCDAEINAQKHTGNQPII